VRIKVQKIKIENSLAGFLSAISIPKSRSKLSLSDSPIAAKKKAFCGFLNPTYFL
jgi:hypothetical protein